MRMRMNKKELESEIVVCEYYVMDVSKLERDHFQQDSVISLGHC